MSEQKMTDAEVLESVECLRGLPIDLNRWRAAVAELHAHLVELDAWQYLSELRQQYGIAGVVLCYMTEEQRRMAEPQLEAVGNLLRQFAQ